MRHLKHLCLILIMALTFRTVEAGLIASFTADGSAFTPAAINVGQFVDVPLYLRQTLPNTELTTGLLSGGAGVAFAPTGLLNASFLSYGAGWDPGLSVSTIDNRVGSAIVQTTVGFFDPAVTDGGTNSILLGTFRFTGIAAGSSVFTLTDADSSLDDTLVDDLMATVLDGEIQFGETASITVNAVTAVPEPSSGILFLLGTGGMMWRLRRERNRRCQQAASLCAVS